MRPRTYYLHTISVMMFHLGCKVPHLQQLRESTSIDDYMSTATRYFRMEYHFCKESYEAGATQPLRVAGSENYADMLTKCLAGPTIRKLRPGLTGYEDHPEPPTPTQD